MMAVLEDMELGPGDELTLRQVYRFEEHLSKLHPENRHVRAKIHQQLQVLRDEGIIEFLGVGGGEHRLKLQV